MTATFRLIYVNWYGFRSFRSVLEDHSVWPEILRRESCGLKWFNKLKSQLVTLKTLSMNLTLAMIEGEFRFLSGKSTLSDNSELMSSDRGAYDADEEPEQIFMVYKICEYRCARGVVGQPLLPGASCSRTAALGKENF